jgi:nitrate/TMAO reductase-like tetraheme cytochrome c subunit
MQEANTEVPRKGLLARTWAAMWRPSTKFALATLLIVGGFGGVILWGGFNWAMEASNSEAFCVSCHEMRDTVYKELKETVHFTNRSGVRATCSDCHVPKQWHYKVIRKIQATNELFHKFAGTIDTPEKFEAARLELAQKVWRAMKSTDSRECRNCHLAESMDSNTQNRPAQRMHRLAIERSQTCIECHQGIAHRLPEGWNEAAGN